MEEEEYSSSSLEDTEDEFRPHKKYRLESSGSESSDDGETKKKNSEHQKMEFSEVLEIDGIWRSGPHFGNFRKKEMEIVVKLGARTLTDASKFVLPKFEKPGSKFAMFDVSDGIFNDRLKWSRKEKGKPVVKPRKRTVSLAGEQFDVTSFCSPLCSSFKKFVGLKVNYRHMKIYRLCKNRTTKHYMLCTYQRVRDISTMIL
ncbi:hypothetical protein GCK72_007910 [Caenorhabditis remanei]|uniref:Uncharacterized protein n=1 Tax=Caenorhabditis remanei TaxID=31234 RepID=A0A6A5HIF9_CAERE|nr:hypothetical protein GCK72_007910 [Caenorhabditis remanei]KAF1767950.1 hypothetical protein GCK72_007910 [Caenorhabditis remanei]